MKTIEELIEMSKDSHTDTSRVLVPNYVFKAFVDIRRKKKK